MRKLKLTKVIAGALVVASALALNPTGVSAAWKNDNVSWWFTEGNSWATGWRLIDGNWYHFNKYGYMDHDDTIDGYYLNSSGAWSTYTLDEAGRYKEGTIINLSGTVKKYYWEHPVQGKLAYYILELDTPANFNVLAGYLDERAIYDGTNEIQITGSAQFLDTKINQHINLRGKIWSGGGTWYYKRPVSISDCIFN